MSVSAQPRMAETDKPCRGRNSAAEASDGHGRQEQERVTDAARSVSEYLKSPQYIVVIGRYEY